MKCQASLPNIFNLNNVMQDTEARNMVNLEKCGLQAPFTLKKVVQGHKWNHLKTSEKQFSKRGQELENEKAPDNLSI